MALKTADSRPGRGDDTHYSRRLRRPQQDLAEASDMDGLGATYGQNHSGR